MAALLVRVVAGLSSWQSVHRAQVAAHAAALLRLYSAAQTTTPTSSTASGTASGTASSRRRKASPCPAMRLKAVAPAGEAALGDSVLQGIIALLRMPDYEEASAAVAAVEVIQALQKQACLRRPEADMHQLLAALLRSSTAACCQQCC